MKRFYGALGALAVIGIGLIGWLMMRTPAISIPANVLVTAADTSGFHGYLLGSDSAPVKITEYGDYQCPLCASWDGVQFPYVKEQLIRTGKVQWRYRDFPLDQIHKWTRVASHAAACADEQGKYWPMHEALFAWQSQWAFSSDAPDKIRGYAGQVGLDLAKYDDCMKTARYAGRIQASSEEGIKLGVDATPTFLIAGRLYSGTQNMNSDDIARLVDSLIAAQPKPRSK
ncbi:MAG TPA: thioredoxin domain-containing protein [Gemmatimonadales bacterium]|nr:thioredoxin domain-containing protein [Gemmatimonadales bacterium]